MKRKNPRRAAFFTLRALVATLLCLTAGMLTLLAFGLAPLAKQRALSTAQASAGGAVKLDKNQPEQRPIAQAATAAPYTPYVPDLRPVAAVRSGKLRDTAPIDAATVPKVAGPRPARPKPEKQSGGPAGPIQTAAGPLAPIEAQASAPNATGPNFDGVGVGLLDYRPGSNPPDVNGRVGATQYFQWNNTSFAIFDKTTGALQYGPAAGNTLFQALGGICASHNDGDPVVSYDILAGRWVVSQFVVGGPEGSASHQCFAVSTTSDATGEYYLYDFVTDPVNFVDYPHQGVWPDGYYMAAHIFAGPGLVFSGGRLYVFEREKMIYGLPARMQVAELGLEYGHLPADLDSLTPPPAGEPAFILGPNFAEYDITDSFRAKVTWDPAPTMVLTRSQILGGVGAVPCVSGATAEGRDCVPQPPPAVPTDYLDNLSFHFMYRLAYRNQGTHESLVVSGPSAGSASTPPHGAVEWFEFRDVTTPPTTPADPPTHPTLFQSGTYDPDTSFRWMPSIAMDKDGNIALGYSKSSPTVMPGIYITGRLASDPPGIMGAEIEMKAGEGVQQGGGNRWGDYTAMTLDPIDQCTFWYTNEYLKTNGAFNWSTRIASYRYPSCVSAANLYGTVTGTIISAENGAPIPGVTVTLSNGYAGAADANGVYTILVPAGTYTATAADDDRNCTAASPGSATVSPPGGGTVVQNFIMTGVSKIDGNSVTLDDSLGTNNGIVNKNECVLLDLGVKNNGCAKETAISAKLTTTTPGVTVIDRDSSYPDMPIDATATNTTPFKIFVSNEFGCGTEIALSLELTYSGGTKTIEYTVPTCAGGPDQFIPTSQLTTSDPQQSDRIGRDQRPSTCAGKTSPGGGFTTTAPHYYETYTFTNTAGAPRCYTVTINAELGGPGDIQSAAYDQTYDPTMIDANYLGDSGISGLGTTVSQASYSFTVPANHNFVVVVVTSGNTTNGSIASSPFSGTVSGFIDNNPGPGACTSQPVVPVLTSAATRLNHGAAGTFDLPISLTGGTVEPRRGNGNYTAVLRFNTPVQGGNAAVSSGSGSVNSVSFSGNDMLVNLTGVTDQQRLTINATDITSASGGVLSSATISVGFLVGDTSNDAVVNSGDAIQVRNRSGQATGASNFRFDVNRDGAINSGDAFIVRNQSGKAIP